MLVSTRKPIVATLAVGAALLAAAGPASAGSYQHDQTDLEMVGAGVVDMRDGTSNTLALAGNPRP